MIVDIKSTSSSNNKVQALKITAMPGKHVPPGVLGTLNDLVGAVPPTNGWILELGTLPSSPSASSESHDMLNKFQKGYRIYISGDTLMVPELHEIPKRYPDIDLMLIHLGGTTIPSPKVPLLMVTMDAVQGLELVRLIGPDGTSHSIPTFSAKLIAGLGTRPLPGLGTRPGKGG